MKKIFIACFAFLLVACGDPHDTRVPLDITKWNSTVKPALQKMTPEERILFTDYVRRHTVLSDEVGLHGDLADPIPEDMTIGKAIEEQRRFIARANTRADKPGAKAK